MSGASERGDSRFRRRRLRSRVGRALPYLIGFAIAVVAGALAWLIFFSSVLGVHGVKVEGLQTIGADQVREQADVTAGAPLATLDTDEIAGRLEELPRVADASVHRDWPRGITLEVQERTTVAVLDDAGEYRGVDKDGVAFRDYDQRPAGVPVVQLGTDSTDEAGAETDEELLAEAAVVIDSLDDATQERVRRIEVDSVDSIEFRLGNGDRVRWGSADDSDRKAEVLTALLDVPAAVYDVTSPEHPATS